MLYKTSKEFSHELISVTHIPLKQTYFLRHGLVTNLLSPVQWIFSSPWVKVHVTYDEKPEEFRNQIIQRLKCRAYTPTDRNNQPSSSPFSGHEDGAQFVYTLLIFCFLRHHKP